MARFVDFYGKHHYYNLEYINLIVAESEDQYYPTINIQLEGQEPITLQTFCSPEACKIETKYILENLNHWAITVESQLWATADGLGVNVNQVREVFIRSLQRGGWAVLAEVRIRDKYFVQKELFRSDDVQEAERYIKRLLNGN